MMNWVSKLFRREAQPPTQEPQPESPAPVLAPSRKGNPAVLPYFFEKIREFGFEDFYTRESDGQPHLLQAVTMTADNYLHQFYHAADDILRKAYEDSEAYPSIPEHNYERLYPEVSEFISAQDPATAAAFKTLLRYCQKYSKSVAETAPSNGAVHITVAQHALSNPEAAELKDALEKIWKAAPEADPYLVEGMDYVMASQPAVVEAFPNYCWVRNDRRSDYDIAGKIKSHWSLTHPGSEKAAVIVKQSAENIALLKPHAERIAETVLAWCLSRALDIDRDYRLQDVSREKARAIFSALDAGTSVADIAKDIAGGAYGPLVTRGSVDSDAEAQKRTEKAVAGAPDFVALARDLRSGAWFDAEQARLSELAKEYLLTPEEKAQRERERHDREVDQIASDATVLQSAVHVHKSLRLKPGG